jgi:hypothetical protein
VLLDTKASAQPSALMAGLQLSLSAGFPPIPTLAIRVVPLCKSLTYNL